ncbi:MAG: hypothetical protein WA733_08015 [Methylocystis sp.]
MIESTVFGFIGGVVSWFAINYWGRTLSRFWDLRLEAHETIFFYSNISADHQASSANANDGRVQLRKLGAKIDALRAVLPAPLRWCLRACHYDLRSAAQGLTGLSNSLGARESDVIRFRVQAQRALCLPIDPIEQERVDREKRLENVSL